MKKFCQLDRKWSSLGIGNTKYSLGRWGCTISSLCMVLSKFVGGDGPTPAEARKLWRFDREARILWASSNFQHMKFKRRYYRHDFEMIKEYANDNKLGVIAAVNNDSHWVAVSEVDENGEIYIMDPLNFEGAEKLSRNRYKISGFATFESLVESEIPDWGKEGVVAAKKAKFKELSPQELSLFVDPAWLSFVCYKIGDLKEAPKKLTRLEFIVWLHRKGLI